MNFRKFVNTTSLKSVVEDIDVIPADMQNQEIEKNNLYYGSLKDPGTGRAYNIPYLSYDSPTYIEQYVTYMKMMEDNPEKFQKILNWE